MKISEGRIVIAWDMAADVRPSPAIVNEVQTDTRVCVTAFPARSEPMTLDRLEQADANHARGWMWPPRVE